MIASHSWKIIPTQPSHLTGLYFSQKAPLEALTDIFGKFYTDRQPNTCLRKVKWCGFYKIPILHLRTQCKTSYICWQSCRAKLVEEFLNFLIPSTPSLGLLLSTFSLGYICFSTSEKACSYTPAASRENSIWPTKTEYHGKGQLTPRKKK